MIRTFKVDTTGLKFNLEVVGESFYQDNIRKVVKSTGGIVGAAVCPEPDNVFDPNAVQVFLEYWDTSYEKTCWLAVGYLSAATAAASRDAMQSLPKDFDGFACEAIIRGGGEGRLYGVWLNLPVS